MKKLQNDTNYRSGEYRLAWPFQVGEGPLFLKTAFLVRVEVAGQGKASSRVLTPLFPRSDREIGFTWYLADSWPSIPLTEEEAERRLLIARLEG